MKTSTSLRTTFLAATLAGSLLGLSTGMVGAEVSMKRCGKEGSGVYPDYIISIIPDRTPIEGIAKIRGDPPSSIPAEIRWRVPSVDDDLIVCLLEILRRL